MSNKPKGKPTSELDLAYIDGRWWKVKGSFGWQFRDGIIVQVEDGFTHDFNSTPRILWRVIPPVENGEGGTIHDWLYRHCGEVAVIINGVATKVQWPREECDSRYKEILEDIGEKGTKRNPSKRKPNPAILVKAMYWGVRLGGWKAWDDHAARIRNEKIAALKAELGKQIMAGTYPPKNL